MSELVLRSGAWVTVTPDSAGWRYLSFRVARSSFTGETGPEEIAIVPLSGACRVEAEGKTWELEGRASVFEGMPSALYLPRDTRYRVEASAGVELAICGALCDRRREIVLIRPSEVEVEVRGAGDATRQINHLLKPDFPAERLLVVEVFTPGGNWSGWPPHKHDEQRPLEEVVLEETYYFRTAKDEAFGFQRLYSPSRDIDVTVAVADGDLVLVPFGYHTTCAPPGYDLYYLNGLAGDRRAMTASDDPAFAWVRGSWEGMPTDPRVPLIPARART